ncbi:MAG: serine hydrolase [Caulobacteraceae bacterium]
MIRPALLLAALLLTSCTTTAPTAPSAPVAPAAVSAAPIPAAPPPSAPPALAARLSALAQGFDGRVGIAVEAVGAGWVAGYDADALYPQQSVSKLWVALTVFDGVDQGRLRLTDPVLVQRGDMSVFNQPIQKLIGDAGYATTVDGLLTFAIAHSDNAANDILVRRVGGSARVQAVINGRHLGAIRSGPEEKLLQSKIAGLSWDPAYSFGLVFWTARDQVAPQIRADRLTAYLADPDDGASPRALVDGLARLRRGALLSPASTARFLQILASTETGPARLKAGLPPGWTIAHKTGTGQVLGELATGYNDVGLLTAPDGRTYAVAVMIASTRRPVPERQALMAQVAQAIAAQHDAP